jgi:hypothetical protein
MRQTADRTHSIKNAYLILVPFYLRTFYWHPWLERGWICEFPVPVPTRITALPEAKKEAEVWLQD